MEAAAKKLPDSGKSRTGNDGLMATAIPTITPTMLVPRKRRAAAPYPFDDPATHWFYFARNGIYSLARLWGLAGREVLFPAYFHGVELEALLEAGVRPRFFPVHEKMRVDPEEVIARITPETKAVYLIHYAGFPGPVEELAAACRERNVLLIEDCALSLLSCKGEKPLGSWGDAAIFCLYKTLPVPNGGAVVLRRGPPLGLPTGEPPSFASTMAPVLSSMLQGMEIHGGAAGKLVRKAVRTVGNAVSRAARAERVATGTQHFDRSHVGLSMSNLSHVVASAQDFSGIVERRRRNYFHLLGKLRGLSQPVFSELPPGVCPLFYPFQTDDKQAMLARLQARGIEAVDFWRVGHPAVPPGAFPEVDRLRQTILEIPCHQDLSPMTVDKIAAAVAEVAEEVK